MWNCAPAVAAVSRVCADDSSHEGRDLRTRARDQSGSHDCAQLLNAPVHCASSPCPVQTCPSWRLLSAARNLARRAAWTPTLPCKLFGDQGLKTILLRRPGFRQRGDAQYTRFGSIQNETVGNKTTYRKGLQFKETTTLRNTQGSRIAARQPSYSAFLCFLTMPPNHPRSNIHAASPQAAPALGAGYSALGAGYMTGTTLRHSYGVRLPATVSELGPLPGGVDAPLSHVRVCGKGGAALFAKLLALAGSRNHARRPRRVSLGEKDFIHVGLDRAHALHEVEDFL